MKAKLSPSKIVYLLCVLVLLVGLIAYRTYQASPAPAVVAGKEAAKAALVPCELSQGRCDFTHQGTRWQIRVLPSTGQALTSQAPLQLEIAPQLAPAENNLPAPAAPQVSLRGRDMFMGIIKVPLQARQGLPLGWQGEFSLSRCQHGRMVWQLDVVWSETLRQQFMLSVD
ncbi:MAG: hypothetical protein ACRCYV_07635 [Aeromonas sp.]